MTYSSTIFFFNTRLCRWRTCNRCRTTCKLPLTESYQYKILRNTSKNENNQKAKTWKCHQPLQRNTKLTPTRNRSRVTQQHHQHQNDTAELNKQKRISLLEVRTRQLEQKVDLFEISLIVAKNTKSLLEKEVDDLITIVPTSEDATASTRSRWGWINWGPDQGKCAESSCSKSVFWWGKNTLRSLIENFLPRSYLLHIPRYKISENVSARRPLNLNSNKKPYQYFS